MDKFEIIHKGKCYKIVSQMDGLGIIWYNIYEQKKKKRWFSNKYKIFWDFFNDGVIWADGKTILEEIGHKIDETLEFKEKQEDARKQYKDLVKGKEK